MIYEIFRDLYVFVIEVLKVNLKSGCKWNKKRITKGNFLNDFSHLENEPTKMFVT